MDKNQTRKALETLYSILWECSASNIILHEDEGVEWINETGRDHVGIAIITSDIIVDENGDERWEQVHTERYFDPKGLADFICNRIQEIVRPCSGKLWYEKDLDRMTRMSLIRAGYIYASDLEGAKRNDLLKIRNFGERSLKKLEIFCNLKGIKLED